MNEGGTQAKILVVDDSSQIRTILAKRLRAAGHAVELANDGRLGLEAASRWRPDLILTDWMMPEMDGVEMIRVLRREPALRSIYIILLTARDAGEDRLVGLECGADEYLVKPWSDEELQARIRIGLRLRALQEEVAQAQRREALLEMAATLGHEINNPLMVLSAALQIARQVPPSGRALLEFLSRCEGQVERIAQVVAALSRLKDPRVISYVGDTCMLDIGTGDAR